MKIKIAIITLLFINNASFSNQQSIQGKAYNDRINGIYDMSIKNDNIEEFLNKLKNSVNDVKKFSSLVSYPCRWNGSQKIILNTSQDFIKNAGQILTEKLKNLILNSTVNDLFSNSQGFMLGEGEIWFDPNKGITVFNTITK